MQSLKMIVRICQQGALSQFFAPLYGRRLTVLHGSMDPITSRGSMWRVKLGTFASRVITRHRDA